MFQGNFQNFHAITYKSIKEKHGMNFLIYSSYLLGFVFIPWLNVNKSIPLLSPSPDAWRCYGVKWRTIPLKCVEFLDATEVRGELNCSKYVILVEE